MFPTTWDFKEILNVVYVSIVCNFAARKHHHCKLQCWCRSMSPSLCANLAYVSVTVRNVAGSKCPHCCSVNAAMLPPLYVAIIVCKSCVCVYYCMQCCKMSPLRWCKMLLKLHNATAPICYCHTLYWSKP